jgi:hypothetical protein
MGVAVVAIAVVVMMSVAPHPVTWVQKEMVDVVVVTARLVSFRYSSKGIRGARVGAAPSAARLATMPYERVVVHTLAVAVSQLTSSGSGLSGYVGLQSGPMLEGRSNKSVSNDTAELRWR